MFATRCTFTVIHKLRCSHVKAVYYASVCRRCQLLYCILTSCSRARLKRGWMINVYKSQFSLQWKFPHTHAPHCAGKTPQLLLLLLSESRVRFSLKHFRPIASTVGSLSGHHVHLLLLLLLLVDWTVEERSAATVHTLTSSLCCQPCTVWLTMSRVPICCISLSVEWHLFAVLKLVTCSCHYYECPLTKVTSSHVGTVCWLRVTGRQISLNVWCYLHVIRAGNEHQLVYFDKMWLGLASVICHPE